MENIRDKTIYFGVFVGFYAVEPQNSTKKIHFSNFFGQKQGPGTSLKCEKNKGQDWCQNLAVPIRINSVYVSFCFIYQTSNQVPIEISLD